MAEEKQTDLVDRLTLLKELTLMTENRYWGTEEELKFFNEGLIWAKNKIREAPGVGQDVNDAVVRAWRDGYEVGKQNLKRKEREQSNV